MGEALRLARATGRLGNIPVGAVVVDPVTGQILGRGANLRHTLNDPTAHAELLALRAAARTSGSWRLTGCVLYVTLAPCAMCLAAAEQARIALIRYGTERDRSAETSPRLVHERVDEPHGAACQELIWEFFTGLREPP